VYRSLIASEALLGLFFLYWLNTPTLRRFFQSAQLPASNEIRAVAKSPAREIRQKQDVYDQAGRTEVGDALRLVGSQLLQNVLQNPTV
jgi:hypothetical protein